MCFHMLMFKVSLIEPLIFLPVVAMAVDVLHDVENVLLLYSSYATSPGNISSNSMP